ncbi:unnamed protein product [Caenorhabditis nigoni]
MSTSLPGINNVFIFVVPITAIVPAGTDQEFSFTVQSCNIKNLNLKLIHSFKERIETMKLFKIQLKTCSIA